MAKIIIWTAKDPAARVELDYRKERPVPFLTTCTACGNRNPAIAARPQIDDMGEPTGLVEVVFHCRTCGQTGAIRNVDLLPPIPKGPKIVTPNTNLILPPGTH